MANCLFLSSLLWLVAECMGSARYDPVELKEVSLDDRPITETKKVYFIRHAQSMWNQAKAESTSKLGSWFMDNWGAKKIRKLVTGLGNTDISFTESFGFKPSAYKDAPLSDTGTIQVVSLANWFWSTTEPAPQTTAPLECHAGGALYCFAKNVWGNEFDTYTTDTQVSPADTTCNVDDDELQELKVKIESNSEDLVVGTSNLDRAIRTLAIFLRGVTTTGEYGDPKTNLKINIVSALQETSSGADAQSLLGASSSPSTTIDAYKGLSFNGEWNKGNQDSPFFGSKKAFKKKYTKRFNEFCDFLFSDDYKEASTFLLSGHSYWLMFFYIQSFGKVKAIPLSDPSSAPSYNAAELLLRLLGVGKLKKIKLGNASMIKFEVVKGSPKGDGAGKDLKCHVKAQSTKMIYGNWQVSAKCHKEGSECTGFCPCKDLKAYLEGSVHNLDQDTDCPAVVDE
jgi:hypothetical protein